MASRLNSIIEGLFNSLNKPVESVYEKYAPSYAPSKRKKSFKRLDSPLAKKIEDELLKTVEIYMTLRENIDNIDKFPILNFNSIVGEGLALLINEKSTGLHSDFYQKKAELFVRVEHVLFEQIGYLLFERTPPGESAEDRSRACYKKGKEYMVSYLHAMKEGQ